MAFSVNTTPLLEEFDSDHEPESEVSIKRDSISEINSKPLFRLPEPRDRYNLNYLIFYLLGMITVLPWCFFVTADDYWSYKFRDTSQNNGSLRTLQKETTLQIEFTSYLNVASAVPNFLFLVVNMFVYHLILLNKRILSSLIFTAILFLVTLVFVNINTDNWENAFFIITLVIVVLLNGCSAILSGSVFGMAGKFPVYYMTAIMGAQALGGIFAAVAQIVSLSIGASPTHSAFVYFTIGTLTVIASIVGFLVLTRTVFFKFYMQGRLQGIRDDMAIQSVQYSIVLKKIICVGLSSFFVFVITLVVYPGITVLIASAGKGQGNNWNDVYFVPTINYLLFNVGDYLGRIIAGKLQTPRSGFLLLIFSISRFVFIPLLLLCNIEPAHSWAVVFKNDYEFIAILFFCAITNGYIANLTTTLAPRIVEYYEKETASTMMSVFMGFGLAVGSLLGILMVKLL